MYTLKKENKKQAVLAEFDHAGRSTYSLRLLNENNSSMINDGTSESKIPAQSHQLLNWFNPLNMVKHE